MTGWKFSTCDTSFLIKGDNTDPLCHPWSSNPVKILIQGHPVSMEDIRMNGLTLMVPDFIPGILVDGSIGWWPENGNPSTFGSPIWSWMSGWSEWNPWEFRRTDPLEFSNVGKNKLLELRESICMVNSPCSIYLKFEVNFLCIELNVDITNPNYHKYWQQTVYNPIAYRTYSLVEDLKN